MARRPAKPEPVLLYCARCMVVQEFDQPAAVCDQCKIPMLPAVDRHGAYTREYLLARKVCCENSCRNCPYTF